MKTFRFIQKGIHSKNWYNYLPADCQKLPLDFSLKDISPGMFSQTILSRLEKSHDGTTIFFKQINGKYKYSSGLVTIKVTDLDEKIKREKSGKERSTKLSKTRSKVLKQLRVLIKDKSVNSYIKLMDRLRALNSKLNGAWKYP